MLRIVLIVFVVVVIAVVVPVVAYLSDMEPTETYFILYCVVSIWFWMRGRINGLLVDRSFIYKLQPE